MLNLYGIYHPIPANLDYDPHLPKLQHINSNPFIHNVMDNYFLIPIKNIYSIQLNYITDLIILPF